MGESDFWGHLEMRASREMSGIEECRALRLWCDGFIPVQYALDDSTPHIAGRAWVGLGSHHQEGSFVCCFEILLMIRQLIDWRGLLPDDNVTRWLTVDRDHKLLEIEPGAAVLDAPDPPQTTSGRS